MIDTHCHLTDERLFGQLDDVLLRAEAAGVTHMITIGTDLADSRECLSVCCGRDKVRCAVGVHPTYVDGVDPNDLPTLRDIQADPSVVAIGEIGLDYHYGKQNRERQFQFLEYQLSLAVELNRAVVIHCREAIDDCLGVLKNFPAARTVFHCFTGTSGEARAVLDAGHMLGFTGVVTFKNTTELREIVAFTPLDRMLVETDAPYLSPEPLRRQKVNEPALVTHVAAKIAEVLKTSSAEVDRRTTENAARLYGWP